MKIYALPRFPPQDSRWQDQDPGAARDRLPMPEGPQSAGPGPQGAARDQCQEIAG